MQAQRSEGFVIRMDRLRRDAPFFGILLAILLTALALLVATLSLVARM
jgi:hypothetical protein